MEVWAINKHAHEAVPLRESTVKFQGEPFVPKATFDKVLCAAKTALEFYGEGHHLEVPGSDNNLNETVVIDDGDVAREALIFLEKVVG